MPQPLQLLVGLGNPGAKYAATRHNAGTWLIETLAKRAGCTLRPENKFHGQVATTTLEGQACHLLIPSTFMNLSGQSVKAVAQFYKIPPSAILIIHDEIDLPPGIARLKFDGGAGGHNGLSDIIAHLQSKQFYRLRLGVGHPGQRADVADYVLKPPSNAERPLITEALERAEAVLPFMPAGEFQKAMQQLHSE